jgi:Bacterial SH3 domain
MENIETGILTHDSTDELLRRLSLTLSSNSSNDSSLREGIKSLLAQRVLTDGQLAQMRLLLIEELNNTSKNVQVVQITDNEQITAQEEEQNTEGVDDDEQSDGFLKRHKIWLISLLALALVGSIIYVYFFSMDIEKEAGIVATKYCECQQQSTLKGITLKKEFEKTIENSTDISQLQQNYDAINKTVEDIKNSANTFRDETRLRIKSSADISKFDGLLEQKRNYCSDSNAQSYKELSDGCENRLFVQRMKVETANTVVIKQDIRDLDFGTVVVDQQVANVKENPDKEHGTVLYQVRSGTQLDFATEQLDERGIYWYAVTNTEGVTGWVSGLTTNLVGFNGIVTKPQTFFHNWDETTNTVSQRRQSLEINDKMSILKRIKGYVYTEFTNSRGITTKGWISMDDITID